MSDMSVAVVIDNTEYVLIVRGVDDVFDGQLCRVICRPTPKSGGVDWLEVECWTGYTAWTEASNVIPISGDVARFDALFSEGRSRSGTDTISF